MTTSLDPKSVEALHTELSLAIGELAVHFGRLELDVAELVSSAFGRADIHTRDAINAVMSFRQKLDIVGALAPYRLKNPEHLAEVQQCIKTLGQFEEKRNSLLHAFWALERNPDTLSQAQFVQSRSRAHRTKGLIQSRNPSNILEIQALAKAIREFRNIFGQQGSLYFSADLLHEASAQPKK